ncbi:MAG: hypothetical protein NWQ28_02835, partial [Nodularia sp. (in: cyanobacteria)]|nr:hypothetical protein [Nodularia sp. (in: cyanobacteria)]
MLDINRLQLQGLHRLQVAKVASTIAVLVGILVLFGWFFDLQLIKRFGDTSLVAMKPNTALCFLLSGASLWMLLIGHSNKSRS